MRVMLRRRVARGKEVRERLAERRGVDAAPRPAGTLLWLHGASVGEALSAIGVVRAFLDADASAHVLFTTNTVASARLLGERLPARAFHRFVPLDVPAWGARFLDHWRPDAAAFIESEIWPNLLAGCARRSVPVVLLNGRMSARSLRRWRRAPGFARAVLRRFERIEAQSAVDAERFAALGARQVRNAGNLKFAAAPLPVAADELARLKVLLMGRPVWIAASTHEGEEEIATAVHTALAARHEGLVTIIAPRHPERRLALAGARRSLGGDPPDGGVWLADTMGELGLLYRLAPVAFVGGSLIPHGGQNPLEPARLGCAVAVGPHHFNFAEPVSAMREAGGLAVVDTPDALTGWVDAMLADPARRARMAAAGAAAADRFADLPERVAAMLAGLVRRAHVAA
ncbi:MAG: 3-deoxy-D-manno-octulosonic acid transferase [Acidisphaera sp.]|nr:3-deoxy-D-manno-octulosonic acid transferase [Acidisphaera sp.]